MTDSNLHVEAMEIRTERMVAKASCTIGVARLRPKTDTGVLLLRYARLRVQKRVKYFGEYYANNQSVGAEGPPGEEE